MKKNTVYRVLAVLAMAIGVVLSVYFDDDIPNSQQMEKIGYIFFFIAGALAIRSEVSKKK